MARGAIPRIFRLGGPRPGPKPAGREDQGPPQRGRGALDGGAETDVSRSGAEHLEGRAPRGRVGGGRGPEAHTRLGEPPGEHDYFFAPIDMAEGV